MALRPGSIEDLKSLISDKGGFAKANLYYVLLPSWSERGFGGTAKPQELGILCKAVTLPSRSLATIQRIIGPDMQDIAYGYQNGRVSMAFRVLNDQSIRSYFETWQQNIVQNNDRSAEGNYSIAFPDQYMKNVFIYQLERGRSLPIFNRNFSIGSGPINIDLDFDIDIMTGGGANYQWALMNAYPVSYQSETLSDDGKDQVSEITIDFSYKNWVGSPMKISESPTMIGSAGVNASSVATKAINKIYDILN